MAKRTSKTSAAKTELVTVTKEALNEISKGNYIDVEFPYGDDGESKLAFKICVAPPLSNIVAVVQNVASQAIRHDGSFMTFWRMGFLAAFTNLDLSKLSIESVTPLLFGEKSLYSFVEEYVVHSTLDLFDTMYEEAESLYRERRKAIAPMTPVETLCDSIASLVDAFTAGIDRTANLDMDTIGKAASKLSQLTEKDAAEAVAKVTLFPENKDGEDNGES